MGTSSNEDHIQPEQSNKDSALYDDPNRHAGEARVTLARCVEFTGYQKYRMDSSGIHVSPEDPKLALKQEFVRKFYEPVWMQNKSVLDLGANAAFFSFSALFAGAEHATAVDMDEVYMDMVQRAKQYMEIDNLRVVTSNVADYEEPADFVLSFALIHWIYSCTAAYGNLDKVIEKLASLTRQALIVEWIDPGDEAIQWFKHIDFNRESASGPFTWEAFREALDKHFEDVELLGNTKATRNVYAAYKEHSFKPASSQNRRPETLQRLLQHLTDLNVPYAVMRNWETLPERIGLGVHGTLDLLLEKKHQRRVEELWNMSPVRGSLRQVPIMGLNGQETPIQIDLSVIGDGRYPAEFAQSALAHRIQQKMFFTLSPRHEFLALLYHVLHHIGVMTDEYARKLVALSQIAGVSYDADRVNNFGYACDLLTRECLQQQDTIPLIPMLPFLHGLDRVVYSRLQTILDGKAYLSRIYLLEEDETKRIRKQTNHDIARREYRILSQIHSEHFPHVYSCQDLETGTAFDMEYVEGYLLTDLERFTRENSSVSVKQFIHGCLNILETLQEHGITHRDLRRNKILVRSGVPVLLDFGWAITVDMPHVTPDALGEESCPPDGIFCDTYAMGKVIEAICFYYPEYSHVAKALCERERASRITDISRLRMMLNEQSPSPESLKTALLKLMAHYVSHHQNNNAENCCNILLKQFRDHPDALEGVGQIILDQGNPAKAEEYFREALTLDERRLVARFRLARILQAEGKTVEAIQEFESLLAIQIGNPDTHCELGILYAHQKHGSKALLHLHHALTLNPKLAMNEDFTSLLNLLEGTCREPISKTGIATVNISIIVPVFNKVEFTRKCLEVLYEKTPSHLSFEVIVMDNASSDGTAAFLAEAKETYSNFRFIRNKENAGFGKACNQGAEAADGKYIVFLNNDTEPHSGWLEAMLDVFEREENVGIVGSRLLYPEGTIQHAGIAFAMADSPIGRLPFPLHRCRRAPADSPDVLEQRDVLAVTGACLMIPADLFRQAGGFHHEYPMYYEDTDLCLQVAVNHKLRVVYAPNSVLIHHESVSSPDIDTANRINMQESAPIFFRRWKEFLMTLFPDEGIVAVNLNAPVDSSQTPAKLVWSSPLLDPSGYADEARNFLVGLHRNGVAVKADPRQWSQKSIRLSDEDAKVFQRQIQCPIEPGFIHVQHTFPRFFERVPQASYEIGRTMFETDRVPSDWVKKCNEMDEIWVPSDFNIETFSWSGVDRSKLFKVPGAIEPKDFGDHIEPYKLQSQHGFHFLSLFDWQLRKGWDVLLRAFVEEFGAGEDVCLIVKAYSSLGLTEEQILGQIESYLVNDLGKDLEKTPDISLLHQHLSQAEMAQLYQAVDAYVMPSRGEGWGRPYMEAMASGLPVIGTGWSGNTEFMNSENSYLIDYKVEDVSVAAAAEAPTFSGHRWAEPSVEHLRSLMREVLENRTTAKEKGRYARDFVAKQFNRESVGRIIKERLDHIILKRSEISNSPSASPAQPVNDAEAVPSLEDLHLFTKGHILVISNRPGPSVDYLHSRDLKATDLVYEHKAGLLQSMRAMVEKGERFDGIYVLYVFESLETGRAELIKLAESLLQTECYLIIRTSSENSDEDVRQVQDDTEIREIQDQGLMLIQSGFEPCYCAWDLDHNKDMLVIGRRPGRRAAGPKSQPTILWRGPQFVCNSLSWVNRNYCLQLIRQMDVSLTLSAENETGIEAGTHPANFPALFDRVSHRAGRDFDLTVTHFWPPDLKPAETGHWIHIQPWEYGSMLKEWFPHFRDRIDEIWVHSNHTRDGFVRDGISPDKIAVIPHAVETDVFNTEVPPSSLVDQWTHKKFRFFFCGGTIARKGIDVLMKAYLQAFRRSDDVCLIIKDFGTDTFYVGQNMGEHIRELQNDSDAPEIVYVTETFTAQELASIYRACQVLVHPYRGEGFGLPVAEAMACGLPVIVSKGGACDDFCPPDETFWVEAKEKGTVIRAFTTLNQAYMLEPSVESLIEQMRLVFADQKATRARGERSAEHINRTLSWEKTGQLMAERIREVLKNPVIRFQKQAKASSVRKKNKRKRKRR